MPLAKKKKGLSREQALEAIPVKNERVSEQDAGGGGKILVLPRKDTRPVKILSKVLVVPGEKKLELDDIGAWVWDRCDGSSSVRELTKELAGAFKISTREAEVSLMSFLKKLSEKKLIGFLLEAR